MRANLLRFLCIFAFAATAQAVTPVDADKEAAWMAREAAAQADIDAAAARKRDAAERYQAERQACHARFQVTRCQHQARDAYNAARFAAQREIAAGEALQREVRRERVADKQERRALDSARKEAELPGRESSVAEKHRLRDATEAQKLEDNERKAAEGQKRHAQAEARLAARQAAHERRVAETMEKARRKAESKGENKAEPAR